MDWKYIFSISPEDINDDEKDQLFGIVTWFDGDNENPTLEQSKVLLKISQELLKYKGEQVETLIHELDEIAIKQGEEEAKKLDSNTDFKSSRFEKTHTIEFENLEERYNDLKSKYKKQQSQNQKFSRDLSTLRKQIKSLEHEKSQLEQELQTSKRDGSESSDISETIKDQHRELVETVHSKNKQLSSLLQDIEEIEKENVTLQEKLVKTRDELAFATSEIQSQMEKMKALKFEIKEAQDTNKKLSVDNEILKEELSELTKQKTKLEADLREFTEEVDKRIEAWQKILDDKDSQIKELKMRSTELSRHSSTSPSLDEGQPHITALQKLLAERDLQIMDLQNKLQDAIKEMEVSTELIESLKKEKEEGTKKNLELNNIRKEFKKQLKLAHERCQMMQEEVTDAEKKAADTDEQLKNILTKLKEDGRLDEAHILEEIQESSALNRINDKHIRNLVRNINKLQETCEDMAKENSFLREKMGISDDEELPVKNHQTKHKQYKKEIAKLKRKLLSFEEENISLRTELKNLNKMTSVLRESLEEKSKTLVPTKVKKSSVEDKQDKKGDADLSLSIGEVLPSGKLGLKERRMFEEENKALSEENEALRRGMHEILNSLNAKQESSSKEIKSTTLEKLLRALDVKHISGWYHPAMRLQAEVHNIEGVNKELREQLRLTRTELDELRNEKLELLSKRSSVSSPRHFLHSGIQKDIKALNDLNENVDELMQRSSTDAKTCEEIATKMNEFNEEFAAVEKQLADLNRQSIEEKRLQDEKIEQLENKITEYDHHIQSLETKVKIFVEDQSIDDPIKKIAELSRENVRVRLQRGFLEAEREKLHRKIENSRSELLRAETENIRKMSVWYQSENKLKNKIKVLEMNVETSVSFDEHRKMKKELENLTVKFRELMEDFERQSENNQREIVIMKSSKEMLQDEKQEMKKRLTECLTKLNSQSSYVSVEDKIENLSKQLSESEINVIAERQRANHINNLYELVKDQLNKSEERVKEYENYTKDVMHKNLMLQGQMKDVEDKLCQNVEVELYNRVKEELKELSSRNDELTERIGKLQEEKQVLETTNKTTAVWSSSKEEEFLALKHQIVDLLSNTDDKAVIARISADLVRSRANENEWKNKFEILAGQLEQCHEEWLKTQRTLDEEKDNFEIKEKHLMQRNRVILDILENHKLQYHGCIPLISEQKFIEKLKMTLENNHASFMSLNRTQNFENESIIMKEQAELEMRYVMDVREVSEEVDENIKKVLNWLQEKKLIELDLIRYRRQAEFKDIQLKQCNERIEVQNDQISKLEEDLFLSQRVVEMESLKDPVPQQRKNNEVTPPEIQERSIVFTRSQDVQTEDVPCVVLSSGDEAKKCDNLKIELLNTKKELETKEELIQQLKTKLNESEMNVSLFRKQIGDKQAQITFYEKHILELQHHVKKDETDCQRSQEDSGVGNLPSQNVDDVTIPLKATIKTLQDTIALKEGSILHFQALLKEDRDNHSLAAARMQEELKLLKISLAEERQKKIEFEDPTNEPSRSKAAIDQYVKQVHALEQHADDLHTQVTTLESQLASSRQEAVRWRSLANDRLKGIDEMRQSLEGQHKNEISLYQKDSEKWREEVLILKELINKHKNEISQVQPDLQNILKSKDEKIQELTAIVGKLGDEINRMPRDENISKALDDESAEEKLLKENESLRKKFESLMQRERNAREEIRDLKGQLLKNKQRPATSAKIEKSEKSIKEQLQKKVGSLEEEVDRLRDELTQQISINEGHRVKIADDFDRWKRQKQSQQTIDKLKSKIKEKEVDNEKLQQSCNGYRSLIERLEREKHCLENRVKALKSNVTVYGFGNTHQNEVLLEENAKLTAEVEELRAKLEMQQRHSGGLGAAIMQEKLEAQERKLAIMELTGKGTSDIRAEMERMQCSISNLQKMNLFLEAKNIELKMDLERIHKDVPRFKEQIKHLESYIEVLKTEQLNRVPTVVSSTSHNQTAQETKKISELERTVLVLKRVVEKLQVENKRLGGGKRSAIERIGSGEKLRREHNRLKEQHCESVRKISELESALNATTLRLRVYEGDKVDFKDLITLSTELSQVKEQLDQKTVFLDKVKILLQRAALKEKSLLEEISALKFKMGSTSPRPSTSQVHR